MKFNFKRIASVITGAVMLSSTVALAAAAANQFPEPFVKSGAADVAVVYGSNVNVAQTDIDSALNVVSKLNTYVVAASVTPSTTTTTSGEGDKIAIEKTSDKLNLGNTLSGIWGTSLTKTDLPTMLKEGRFYNKQNTEYKYTQKFDIGALTFSHFSDSDYNDREPTLGFRLAANTWVANYTLDFVTDPEATQGTDLTDFENKNVEILGKNYYVLDFKNSTTKITLLDSANTVSISEGETKTVAVGGKTYTVSINFISTDELVLKINDELTDKMSATGTSYGNTYKLSDGTYVGVKNVNAQNYAGGVKNAEFSLGSGKLEITNGANVKINDKTVKDLYGYISMGVSSTKRTWQKLVLEWKIEDEAFLTPGKELVMPGFQAIKFLMEDTVVPAKEKTTIDYSGSDNIEIKTSIRDGNLTLPLLYLGSTSAGNFSGLGKSATQKLATSVNPNLLYNATSSSTSQYEGFIVSWNNSREAESYYLKASVTYDSDAVRNLTTITNKVTGDDVCEDVDPASGNTCNVGSNIVLTINSVAYTAGGDRLVNMTVNSGGSFNMLYSSEGLAISLPFNNVSSINRTLVGTQGCSAVTAPANHLLTYTWYNNTADTTGTCYPTSYNLWMSEEDKDGSLGQKNFNVTLGTSGSSTYKVTVSAVDAYGATGYETETSSKVWEYYVPSDLATRLRWDKTNSDQYSAELEYHGSQLYGKVFVASPKVVTTNTTTNGTVTDTGIPQLKDNEVATRAANKNLIVMGGSCINTVAATLLGSSTPLCGADFTAATKTKVGTEVGAGKYLIATFASPYNASKVAMLVAGYEATDTVSAATFLTTQAGNVSTAKDSAVVNGVKVTVSGQ